MKGVKVDSPTPEAIAGRSLYSHPPLDDSDLVNTRKLFAHRAGAPPYVSSEMIAALQLDMQADLLHIPALSS